MSEDIKLERLDYMVIHDALVLFQEETERCSESGSAEERKSYLEELPQIKETLAKIASITRQFFTKV